MYNKIKEVIPVLNYFMKNVPDVPHNTVQEYGEYFYIRKPYTVLLFKNYEDAFEVNHINTAFGIINYGKSSILTTCVNGFGNSDRYSITPQDVFFSTITISRDIDKGEYFSLSIENNFYLNFEEFKLLFEIEDPGCTLNIKNL